MTSGEFVHSFRAKQRQQFGEGFTERLRACLVDLLRLAFFPGKRLDKVCHYDRWLFEARDRNLGDCAADAGADRAANHQARLRVVLPAAQYERGTVLADFPAFDRFEIKPDEVSSFRNVLTGSHSVSHLEIRWRRQRFRVRLRGGEIFQQFPFAVR